MTQQNSVPSTAATLHVALAAVALLAGATPSIASQPDTGFQVKYSNGLQFNRNDGMIKLKIGGRIQADFATIHPSSRLAGIDFPKTTPTNTPVKIDYGRRTAVEFRRARLYFSGELYDRVIFKAQYDFAGSSTSLNDLFIGLKKLGPVGTVKVGHFKEPFSLEELTSSKYITFQERTLPSIFDSARNFGIGANNHHLNERLTWALGVFVPTNDKGKFSSSFTQLNLTGRLTGLPHYAEEGRKLLHLGLSLRQTLRSQETAGFTQRPEAHLAQNYVATPRIPTEGLTLMAVEFAWVCGPTSIQAEWKQAWGSRPSGLSTYSFKGAYAYVSYFLTGENRAYKTKTGIFGRVTPKRSFDPGKGGWGAWEIAGRYSFLDLKDQGINGGKQQDMTLGINWYLYSNLRLTANYVFADVKDSGSVLTDAMGRNVKGKIHLYQMRAQLEF